MMDREMEMRRAYKTCPRIRFTFGKNSAQYHPNFSIGIYWARISLAQFLACGRVIRVYQKQFIITFFKPLIDRY